MGTHVNCFSIEKQEGGNHWLIQYGVYYIRVICNANNNINNIYL